MVAAGARGRWLSAPGRLTGVARRPARLILAAVVMLTIAAALAVPAAPTPPEFLHDAVVATIRHGGDFYDVVRDLLRAEPDACAARLLPPALAVVEAALPAWATTALVAAALTILLWAGGLRIGALLSRSSAALLAVSLLAAGIVASAALWLAAPHAAAAAILSALAIVVRHRGQAVAAAAVACAAALIDPAALVTIAVLGALALLDGDRREQAAWLAALLVAAAVLALHLHALSGVLLPPDTMPVGPALARLVGAAFPDVPAGLAAPLLLLAALGWATVGDAIGPRVLGVMIAGVALDGVGGLRSATLPVALVAPGLALAPAALADLVRAARDRRRITVTRVVR
ncbi:hypothetical protein J2Y58_002840 [Sphingomonas sp. BE138]|uniref:hypothetical protein n=1 Tax=Sphingomonas sp. BE138 TaxID=2817845 RepID=UPI00285B2841|nr:hypothetical protein [Sphingomonas sp. BE138]MDR6789467.1 hypothetical protein [Sphingomonas sp. BE138]